MEIMLGTFIHIMNVFYQNNLCKYYSYDNKCCQIVVRY